MSVDQTDSVLVALDILCNIPSQALQPHRTQAGLALQKLQLFIRDYDSSESSDDPASPSDHSHFPRSNVDDHDLTSPPHHCDSSPSSSESHDPLSVPRPPGHPSTSSNSLDLPTASVPLIASKALLIEHRLPPSCSLLLPSQSQQNDPESRNHAGHLSSLPNPLDDHSSSPHHQNTLALIHALDKDQDKIQKYLNKSKVDAIEGKSSWTQEDPRVVDLQIGKKQTSLNLKFRKVLSRRSLAQEYDRWELEKYQTSRISQLVKDLSDSKERADGHIKEYVDANAHRFKNRDLAQQGIQCGIRLLVFERLLGESGSSAILCFSFYRFRSLNFPELDCLGQEVRETPWIWDLVKNKSGWLGSCQTYYDSIVDSRLSCNSEEHEPSKRCLPAPESSAKRPRLGQDPQNGSQLGIPPASREVERHLQPTSAALSPYGLVSVSGYTTNASGCIPWFSNHNGTFEAEATADTGGCIPWFPSNNTTLEAEAPGSITGANNFV